MAFKLLDKRIAVKKIIERDGKTEGGLYVPNTVAKVFEKATVEYVGDTVNEVAVGDTVLLPTNSGNPVTVEGVELHLLFVDRVEAIL